MTRRRTIFVSVLLIALASSGVALWAAASRGQQASHAADAWRTFPEPEMWPGVEWTESLVQAGDQFAWTNMSGIAPVGSSLAAWGAVSGGDGEGKGDERQRSVLWLSDDGLAWVPYDISVAGRVAFSPIRVVVGPWGYLAAGAAEKGEWASLVGSADGLGWVDVPLPAPRLNVIGLLGTRDAYWLAAVDGIGRGAWRTTDGQNWTLQPLPEAFANLQVSALVDSPDGVLLTGWSQRETSIDPVLLRWTEVHGWTALGVPDKKATEAGEGAAIQAIVPFAQGLFAIGYAGPDPACPVAGARLASTEENGANLADTGDTGDNCGWMGPAFWVSVNTTTWREVDLAAALHIPDGAQPPIVRAGGRGLMAIAVNQDAGGMRSLGLWTSADGTAWERIGDGPVLPRDAYLVDAAVLPGRVVLLGDDGGGRPMTWVGVPPR